MSNVVDTLFADVLALPEETRLELVERLIPTLHTAPADVEAHLDIVVDRIEEVRLGKVQLVSGDDAFQQVQRSLSARHTA